MKFRSYTYLQSHDKDFIFEACSSLANTIRLISFSNQMLLSLSGKSCIFPFSVMLRITRGANLYSSVSLSCVSYNAAILCKLYNSIRKNNDKNTFYKINVSMIIEKILLITYTIHNS